VSTWADLGSHRSQLERHPHMRRFERRWRSLLGLQLRWPARQRHEGRQQRARERAGHHRHRRCRRAVPQLCSDERTRSQVLGKNGETPSRRPRA
jgi:hypothetical protein